MEALLTAADIQVQLRPDGEYFLQVDSPFAGRCWNTWKPLYSGRFCWDYSDKPDRRAEWERYRPGRQWYLGAEWFRCARHIDGTWCYEAPWADGEQVRKPIASCFSLNRCPECRAWCSTVTEQQAYGDAVRCLNCTWNAWYSIGD